MAEIIPYLSFRPNVWTMRRREIAAGKLMRYALFWCCVAYQSISVVSAHVQWMLLRLILMQTSQIASVLLRNRPPSRQKTWCLRRRLRQRICCAATCMQSLRLYSPWADHNRLILPLRHSWLLLHCRICCICIFALPLSLPCLLCQIIIPHCRYVKSVICHPQTRSERSWNDEK